MVLRGFPEGETQESDREALILQAMPLLIYSPFLSRKILPQWQFHCGYDMLLMDKTDLLRKKKKKVFLTITSMSLKVIQSNFKNYGFIHRKIRALSENQDVIWGIRSEFWDSRILGDVRELVHNISKNKICLGRNHSIPYVISKFGTTQQPNITAGGSFLVRLPSPSRSFRKCSSPWTTRVWVVQLCLYMNFFQ